jgi:hypothetical protein
VAATEKTIMRFALFFFTLLFACETQEAHLITDPIDSTGGLECAEAADEETCKQVLDGLGYYTNATGKPPVAAGNVDEAKALLESQGYFVAQDVEVLDRPVGFPEEDEFPLEPKEFSEKDGGVAERACEEITKREAPEEWYKPIFAYCRWRVRNSSRAWQLGKRVESKIDGSAVHDRDRSSAHYFYGIAVKTGRMNPKVCPHHRLPTLHVEHPPECIHLSQTYEDRFKVPLDPERKANWLKNTHAAEQFGARGPVDWNAYHGYKAIGGCYPFTAFDRTDVAVTAIVRRSKKICAKYGCDNVNTTTYIRPHWNESI